MSFFPNKTYDKISLYISDYSEQIAKAFKSIDSSQMQRAADTLEDAVINDHRIFVCGNGGSAAISNHLCCDFVKGMRTGTKFAPNVHSLSTNVEIITAIANDVSFEDVFSFQLSSHARPGDVLITISSSGGSPNIISAIEWARNNGVRTIAMSGFSGGKSRKISDISLHVEAENYGVIEDVHQSLMHILAQYVRQMKLTNRDLLGSVKF
ncbi:MAG: SIS domain-containing protein [Nitratireductor sp.]|nr:SIS domain-containing protein [Nitratireductor sp.]